MAVILTTIDMPEKCSECKYCDNEYYSSGHFSVCKLLGDKIIDMQYGSKRYDLCPLESIDRLIEEIRKEEPEQHLMEEDDYFLGKLDGMETSVLIINEYCEV